MHFTVLAIVDNPVSEGEMKEILDEKKDSLMALLTQDLEKPFEKFNINTQVLPHKVYLDAEDVQRMANHYKIDLNDLRALSEKMNDWRGDSEGGVDKIGLYELTTRNPDGRLDYWSMYDICLLGNLDLRKDSRLPIAFVTPKIEWIDFVGPMAFTLTDIEVVEAQKDILDKLRPYPSDALLAFIDCHS